MIKGERFYKHLHEELEAVAKEYPVVQCGAFVYNSKHISYVCIDNVAASCEAICHLISLGHRRIAFINGPFSLPYENERRTGYLQALTQNGIEPREEYMETSNYNHSDAYIVCKRLMALTTPPTAIFCSSDQMAAGAMKFLTESGRRIGKEIDVIGFDGTYLSEMNTPSISCVEQPGYDMGRAAFDLLRERIEDKGAIIKKLVLPYKLALRQSTGNDGGTIDGTIEWND